MSKPQKLQFVKKLHVNPKYLRSSSRLPPNFEFSPRFATFAMVERLLRVLELHQSGRESPPASAHIINLSMAKSSTFFGLRRGSTKSLTFQVSDGKQITKDRVSEVKNPRSQAQMVQRAIMKTASSAYNAGKKIFDHSFEGTTYGQPSMSLFRSLNSQMLRQSLPDINISEWSAPSDDIYPNPYIVSKGTLPTSHAHMAGFGDDGATLRDKTDAKLVPSEQNALLDALGAQVGDMLTALIIDSDHKFWWCRIKINGDKFDKNFITFEMSDPNAFNASWTVADGKGTLAVSTPLSVEATATILSRKGNNVWLRSPEHMVTSAPSNYDDVIGDYPVGDAYILNGGKK